MRANGSVALLHVYSEWISPIHTLPLTGAASKLSGSLLSAASRRAKTFWDRDHEGHRLIKQIALRVKQDANVPAGIRERLATELPDRIRTEPAVQGALALLLDGEEVKAAVAALSQLVARLAQGAVEWPADFGPRSFGSVVGRHALDAVHEVKATDRDAAHIDAKVTRETVNAVHETVVASKVSLVEKSDEHRQKEKREHAELHRMIQELVGTKPSDLGCRLKSPYQGLPAGVALLDQPSILLQARFRVVRFLGRLAELDDLMGWCSLPEMRFGTRLITGPGGAGKSRLAAELCSRLTHRGWRAGFLSASARDDEEIVFGNPTLIVIDYADTDVERVARLTGRLLQRTDGPPVRLLLLARARGAWWTTYLALEPLAEAFSGHEIALGAHPLLASERDEHFSAATTAFASALDTKPPAVVDLSDAAFQVPLLVHLRALLRVIDAPPSLDRTEPMAGRLLEAMLRREAKHWASGFSHHHADLSTMQQRTAVAIASFAGAPTREALKSVLRAHPDLHDARSDLVGRVADALRELYPGDPYLVPLQPDLLTEWLVASDLLGDSPWLATVFSHASTLEQKERMVSVLSRAAVSPAIMHIVRFRDRIGAALDEVIPSLTSTIVDAGASAAPLASALSEVLRALPRPEAASRSVDLIPLHAVGLSQLGKLLAEQTVTHFRELADLHVEHRVELARSLSNLALREGEAGNHHEALGHALESTAIRRELARMPRQRALEELANSLNSLAGCLADVGANADALAAAQESVAIRRRLAEAHPERLGNLGAGLHNLSIRYSASSRHDDGIAAAEEAVHLWRRLAVAQGTIASAELAESLNNLSNRYADTSRWDESIAAGREAVAILRRHETDEPGRYSYALASSLENLANHVGIGWQAVEEALALSDQGIEIHRALASRDPDRYLPALGISLNNRAGWLRRAAAHDEAIRSIQGALTVRRWLADRNPALHLVDLGTSARTFCECLNAAGRHAEAVDAARDAVTICRRLVALDHDRHLPALAEGLHTLGNRVSGEDAVEAGEEAVVLYREVATAHRDEYRPHLALALRNLSISYSELERFDLAAACACESAELYREMAHADDSHRAALAASLAVLSARLRAAGELVAAQRTESEMQDVILRILDPTISEMAAAIRADADANVDKTEAGKGAIASAGRAIALKILTVVTANEREPHPAVVEALSQKVAQRLKEHVDAVDVDDAQRRGGVGPSE
jgi:tetratricopeptide (TPR) repeat protein